jgi:purine-binding chemotaxis protein CheW
MDSVDQGGKRYALRHRLEELEAELLRVQGELTRLGPGESLPGLYLVVEMAGFSAALPTALVAEIVRLVECAPIPQAPAHVLGTFIYRGEPVVAVDLSRYLGKKEEPLVDSHMVVIRGVRPLALVCERVRTLVEAPVVAEVPKDQTNRAWLNSPLVAGLCRSGDELLPLLRLDPLLEGVPA